MVNLLIQLECERQSLSRRLLRNISGIIGASSSGYNIIILLVILTTWVPLFAIDMAFGPVGLAFWYANTSFTAMLALIGLSLILTAALAPIGVFIL